MWLNLQKSYHLSDLIFHHKHKASRIHYWISLSKSPRFEWSNFAGYFFHTFSGKPYEWSGTLIVPWLTRNGCVWMHSFFGIITCAVNFTVNFEYITWFFAFLFNFLWLALALPPPLLPPMVQHAWYSQPWLKT